MRIRIFVGTGGVGKTSLTAATGLQTALDGGKCLVLTIDPAWRLKTALNLTSSDLQQKVDLSAWSAKGELWAALLDVRASLDRAVRLYARPEQAETVLKHPIYHILTTSIAGMQELMAIERIGQAMEDGFESIFVDTAPARHAFEFLDKPEFFVQLVTFPIVKLIGRTYKMWEGSALQKLSKKAFELYTRVEELLGASLVREILDFFSVFQTVAETYADRAKRTLRLLRDPRVTGFSVVTTPFKAGRDADYFWTQLRERRFSVESLIVNRVWPALQPDLPGDLPTTLGRTVAWYQDVSQGQQRRVSAAFEKYSGKIPKLIAVPEQAQDLHGVEALYSIAKSVGKL